MSSVSTNPAPQLGEAKPMTLADHFSNIYRLVIKELRSIRADPTMLILVVYAFTISVNTVATGAVTEATNLSVGIADEDGSDLSRRIAEGLRRPTFQPAVQITPSDIDPMMDQGKLLFVVEIPPNFESDIRAQRQTGIQINVDATAVAQAGNGANYLKAAIANEIQSFISGKEGSSAAPVNLVVRAAFNPNLKTPWFSALTQVINQITLLTVILTGAALIREREQGTVEHLLVMPIVPPEIMLAKNDRQRSRHPCGGDVFPAVRGPLVDRGADCGLTAPVSLGRGDLRAGGRGARHHARHFGDDHGPVRTAGDAGLDGHATLVGQQHADGEHAGLAPICDADDQSDAAFRQLRSIRALPRRRHHPRLAADVGDADHRRGLFHRRDEPVPESHFRRVKRSKIC